MLAVGYLLLIVFFSVVDVYHQYFFASGLMPVVYNAARLIFIFYFIWIYYAVGDVVLSRVGGKTYQHEFSLNLFLLAFVTGAGVWHLGMFMAGFAGLYQRWFVGLLGLIVCVLSAGRFASWREQFNRMRTEVNWSGIAIASLPLLLFLAVKGLYPAGGHDYYNHYFQYYRSVTDSGSLLPNEAWYHFYYNKGDALYFMAMLLTDPLGPQLASAAFIIIGAAMVFSILQHKSGWRQLPWIAVALYFSFLIYTPGPIENMHQGGWADLEKPHEPAAMMMLALIWLVYQIYLGQNSVIYRVGLVFAVVALVFISPTMASVAGLFLMLNAGYFVYRQHWGAVFTLGLGLITAGVLFIGNYALNYALTGIPDDQALMHVLPIINFNKLNQRGWLFEVLSLYYDKTRMLGEQVAFNHDLLIKMVSYLRLDVWWPLGIAAVSLLLFSLCWRPLRQYWLQKIDSRALTVCFTLFATVIIFSLVIGRDQPISYYRYTSFVYAPMLCFCLLLISPLLDIMWCRVTFGVLIVLFVRQVNAHIPANSTAEKTFQAMTCSYRAKNISPIVINSLRFISGEYSIADAYKNQQGWPGRMPWGGLYGPLETIWKLLPPKTRVWSMHTHTYCMLPDCHIEGIHSFNLTRHPLAVYFGSPVEAKKWLQAEHLQYFFIASDLRVEDMLPFSPLFSPAHISENLGIAWSDGNNVLLTWKEQSVRPIDQAWLTHYNHQVAQYAARHQFPLSYMKNVLTIMQTKGSLTSSDVSWNTSNIKG